MSFLKGVMHVKRYIIEFGFGADFHGQSVTKAATKAVLDAVSKSCLSGLQEILGYSVEEMDEHVLLKITIAVTKPSDLRKKEIVKCLPIGKKEVTVVTGGLKVRGINIPKFHDVDDSIETAIACIEVCIEE